MSFGFAPKGWALCNGQLLPINQNQALFSLLGTTFGGDGRVNFALPDLRGRARFTSAPDTPSASAAANRRTPLSIAELPTHTHVVSGTSNSTDPNGTAVPTGNLLASGPADDLRWRRASLVAMGPTTSPTSAVPRRTSTCSRS